MGGGEDRGGGVVVRGGSGREGRKGGRERKWILYNIFFCVNAPPTGLETPLFCLMSRVCLSAGTKKKKLVDLERVMGILHPKTPAM